jgi:poly-gamma-glutamate capsule biosynthesis protein CapA/YwtB (metallophosphatase superfamily)
MALKLILTGDINLMNVADPAVPLAHFAGEFRSADAVFSNLECCFYKSAPNYSDEDEGFYADAAVAEALKLGGIQAVGIANNVNYGDAAIASSTARLDALGIAHTGAGANAAAAYAPVILERGGVRFGFMQRTSVYWATNHEAREHMAGVAVIRANTAYQVPMHKTRPEVPPLNRPGIPPFIVTWVEPSYLQRLKEDIAALRSKVDVLVLSCHWGVKDELLDYMKEIAHAAVDAGADIVMGHGPHYTLPIEVYKGRPVFYGLSSFSFYSGHGGRTHSHWVGLCARIAIENKKVEQATFQFVRRNDKNETMPRALADEKAAFESIVKRSAPFATAFTPQGDQVRVELKK